MRRKPLSRYGYAFMTSHRDSEKGGDQRSFSPRTASVADVALVALNNLDRAVALVGADGTIVFSNPLFAKIVESDGAGIVRACIAMAADQTEITASREIVYDDRRTFTIETKRLPQGQLLVTAEDISARLTEQVLSAEHARTDQLTRLGNRLMFSERLKAIAAQFHRETDLAAVLAINLDRFKAVNESLGRKVGDALLGVVAQRLCSALKPGDIAARLGGDGFGIVQTGQPQPQSAAALAKRLVDLLGRSYIIDGHIVSIGASVGIAVMPAHAIDVDEVLRNCDLALSQAKKDGRATYRFFAPAMNDQMQARHRLEVDLRRALALREFALVYQPQVNLQSMRVNGFEALLRWHNPARGMVSPADFIPLAEEIRLIVPIGEWVIRTACREAARWPSPFNVAVNVSAVQFGSPTLVSTIVSALAESGLDPRRLEVEITEGVLLKEREATLVILRELRAMGVRVAMDDFGTGYSSLSYLHSFPFDKIKIDQSFVRGYPEDGGGAEIVRAIAALGRALGMTTIAEGVETEAQLARVRADGCTDAQGYLISRPLAPELIDEFLRSRTESATAPVTA
jgi:diguanylate cyclase (GGDEF)-like protein